MTSPSGEPGEMRQLVRAEGGFAYGVIGADIHVFGDGMPLYLLENWRPAPQADPGFLRDLPSRILNARFAVVEFTGREEELAQLRGWRDGPPRLAARWLHAPGGQGKTRLAHQLAQESLAMGWKVVTATHGPGTVMPPPGSQDLRLDGAAGLLMIVDYADRWPLTHLTWLLSNSLLYQPGVRTRVLMLARSADVWPAVRATLVNEQVDTSTQHLPELPDDTGQRAEMFLAACNSFAAVYGIADRCAIRPPMALDHPDLGLSLAVHIGALVAVDAHAHGVRPPEDMAALTIYLLDREHAHWARRYSGSADGTYRTPPEVMNRTVFTAAITGAVSRPAGAGVVATLDPLADTESILNDHAICYPPADADRETVLEPLYPDRLAEDFVALTLPGHAADYPAQPWASRTATNLLARAGTSPRGLTLLVSAAHRWPHAGTGHLFPLLHNDPRLAVEGGNAVLTGLAALPAIPVELLQQVAEAFPVDVPADLAVGCATVSVRLAPYRLGRTDDPAEQARLNLQLGNDLSTLGRGDEALEATVRGEEILRGQVQTTVGRQRIEHERLLAQALNNLSIRLAATNNDARAIGTCLEAADLNRRLVAADPEGGHQYHLAVTLANLGAQLSSADQRADAYAALRESADLYRQLARADPQAESGLAVALTNLSAVLSGAGAAQEAFALIREATDIWRRMAQSNPDAYQRDLARSAISMAGLSSQLGQPHEGLQAITEATAIMRRLVSVHPIGYAATLTWSLEVQRDILLDTGQPAQALEVAHEVVEIRRRSFAASETSTDLVALARALKRLSAVAAADGRDELARTATSEAVDLEQRLGQWLDRVGLTHPLAPSDAIARRFQQPAAVDAEPVDDAHREQLPVPWGTTREIELAGKQLARARAWAGLWELICSVPVADACLLASLVPVKRWSPPDETGRELLRALATMDHRHAGRVVKAAAHQQKRTLPGFLFTSRQVSFAPGRAALTITTLDSGAQVITLHDLSRFTSTEVYRGPAEHGSVSCLGPDQVVAVRPYDRRTGELARVVRYTRDTPEVLTVGPSLAGARIVATVHGFAMGLDLAPVAYLGEPGEPLYHVDLSPLGLWRGSLMAADPTATRIAISDGSRVTVTDRWLRPVTATTEVPASLGELLDLAFVSPDELLISGTNGGLCLYRIGTGRLHPVASVASPRLDHLFVIPAWGVVGGWAHGFGRPYFHFMATLAPVGVPRQFGKAVHLHAIAASPDGRYVIHSGQELAAAEFAPWQPVLHDLREPSAWIHRPMLTVTAEDLPALGTLLWAPSALGDLAPLLELAWRMSGYRLNQP